MLCQRVGALKHRAIYFSSTLILSFATSHQYFQARSIVPQHKEFHFHPTGTPPCTLTGFGRAGSLQRGLGKGRQTETAWASCPWKLRRRLLSDFRVAPPQGIGRNHQKALEKNTTEENLSSTHRVPLSSQGSGYQFPWKPGKNPNSEETNWTRRFSIWRRQETRSLLSARLLDTCISFCPPASVSLSVHWTGSAFLSVGSPVWALEPGVPREPYLALQNSIPQMTIWDLSPGLLLVSI